MKKKSSVKKVFFTVGYGIFITILIVLGTTFLLTLFPVFGVEARIVESGSMAPAVKTGSMVVIVPREKYEVGDIITFGKRTDAVPTTHRVIGVEAQNGVLYYETKGDANDNVDPRLVSEREVKGEVVLAVRYLGYIIDFARHPYGFVFLIGLPAGAVVLDELFTIYDELKKRRAKKRKKEGSKDAEETPTEKEDTYDTET
jgi:signal peptidase